ncbi:unnamed protein product [Lactuca virosa]|uniref:Glycine-rich protein n=1 Tax=Lactuca virosa TaxID=75947 RepID=A0AAU9PJ28_9ASTR|nr:unnamed protein product [Lactuca virosa]
MMAIKLFVGICFAFLICTTNIARGRKLVGKENLPLAYGEGTSKIGCSMEDMTCGGGHEYNRKESIKENIGGMFRAGIRISNADDNGERTKNIQAGRCTEGEVGCNDLSGQNGNNKNKIYVKNKSYANKNDYLNIEKNYVVSNNRNNLNNNGSRNNIGNKSGSNNGGLNGNVSQNGNETVNGNGSGNNNSVGIGDRSGNGNNAFNYREESPRNPGSK